MIRCFISCFTRLIASRKNTPKGSLLRNTISRIQYLASGLAVVQTPVFKGEKIDRLKEIKEMASTLLNSQIFYFVIIMSGIAIGLLVWYNRKKDISKLEVQLVPDDTWFITRDDNNRVGIVVSVNLRNRSARGVKVVNGKLSGYSAREYPEDVDLVGPEGEQKLNYPEHTHFSAEEGFYLGPASSETLWFYYESRTVTMRNVLEAPLIIRDSEKKRKTIRVRIPRQADQIAIYREMAKMW